MWTPACTQSLAGWRVSFDGWRYGASLERRDRGKSGPRSRS